MRKSKLIQCAILAFSLTACVTTEQATDATEISVNAYIANEAVEVVQATVGGFSVNQGTIAELDNLQEDISEALQGGNAILQVDSFYSRAVDIYAVLHGEAVDRKGELTTLQLDMLIVLDKTLISLDDKIKAFKENKNNAELINTTETVLEVLGTAKTVLSLYSIGVAL